MRSMKPNGQSPCLHAEVSWRFCTQAWSSAQVDKIGSEAPRLPAYRQPGKAGRVGHLPVS
jgi:hypothetical protein